MNTFTIGHHVEMRNAPGINGRVFAARMTKGGYRVWFATPWGEGLSRLGSELRRSTC